MAEPSGDRSWSGEPLFEHLLVRLGQDDGHVVLNAHTLSSLLMARPHIVTRRPDLASKAQRLLEKLLDSTELPARSQRDLANATYGIRLALR